MVKRGKQCCSAKVLSMDKGKEMYIMRLCNLDVLKNFCSKYKATLPDIKLDPSTKFIIGIIPKSTNTYINLFCCDINMNAIHEKISSNGIAIEGCFNVKNVNGQIFPDGMYQGVNLNRSNTNSVKNSGTEITDQLQSGYFLVDNFSTYHFLTKEEINLFKPIGVSVQMVHGYLLCKDGQPAKGLFEVLLIPKLGGKMIIATDFNDDLIIIYHPNTDYFNLMLLLHSLNVKNCILICNGDKGHMLWKENGMNHYNKTDFIGDTTEIVNNVVVFTV